MDDDIDMPDVYGADDEDHFRRNMQKLREQYGWSQGELARRMQEAGWTSFHQTTVSRIEKGERPVRLGEARGIAKVLGTITSQMILPNDEFLSLRKLELTLETLRLKRQALADAFIDLSTWRDIARKELGEVLEQDPSIDMDGPVADRRQFFIDRAERWTTEDPYQAIRDYFEEVVGLTDSSGMSDGVDPETA